MLILGWRLSGYRGRGDGEWRGRGEGEGRGRGEGEWRGRSDGEWRGRGEGEGRGRGEGEGTEISVNKGEVDRSFQVTEHEETERVTVVVDGDEVISLFWKWKTD